ncbi:CHAT domain-containing protein [Spirosoma migulaei]
MIRWGWLLILCTSFGASSRAQCPERSSFYELLQKISARQPVNQQQSALHNWLINWKKCYPATDSTYASALIQLGLAEFYEGKYPQAIATTNLVLPLYRQSHPALKASDLVKVYYRIGVYYSSNDNSAKAIYFLQRAIKLGKDNKEAKRFVANSHLYLIYAYLLKGDFERALLHADVGGNLALSVNDTITSAKIWEQKAQVLSELHRYQEAQLAVEKAISLLQNYPQLWFSVANQHRLLGTILRALGQPANELKELEIAYQIAKKNQHANLSDFLNSIGHHYFKDKNYQKAIYYYQQGLTIDKSQFSKINLLDRLGLTYAKLGDYSRAYRLYQQGFNSLLPDYKGATMGSLPDARKIRQVAQKNSLLLLVQDKADTWLEWAKSTGNNPDRLRNAQKTYALADSMIEFMRWEHTGQQSKLFWRDKTHRLYESAIETCFLLHDATSAFRFIEKSRAVLLNDKLNELGANRQLTPNQATEEQKLRQQSVDWQAKLASEKSGTTAYTKALDSLHSTQEAQETFVHQVERTNPAYYRYKYNNDVISLTQVQQHLADQKASLVTYFLGDSSLYALGVTPGSTKLIHLSAAVYTKQASELLALNASSEAQNKQFTHYLTVSNQLYQQLLKPLALVPGRVIVSPDGVLLPFEALSTSASRPDFLIHQYAFSYAYSLNQLFKEMRSQSGHWFGRSQSFLGMAPVQFSANLNQVPLAGSDATLARIGNRFSSASLLTGHDATRQAFGQQIRDHQVIQLFTHAEADSTGLEPALFFTDSILRLSELTSAELLPVELVGLSACKTGVGAHQRGEGVFSLARGFASLGVPSILTTLWNVESQATYDLTERFYAKLAEGLPKDLALQQAKLDYLANVDLSGQLPNRWAGLLLVGNTTPLQTSPKLGVWSIGLIIIALGSVWWWFRRRKRPPQPY